MRTIAELKEKVKIELWRHNQNRQGNHTPEINKNKIDKNWFKYWPTFKKDKNNDK